MTDLGLPNTSVTDANVPDTTVHVLGALALELAPGGAVARDALSQHEAGT